MKNVLVYTIHKAGSTFLDLLISQTARRYGIDHLSANQDANFDSIEATSWKQFIENTPTTTCFGPIRAVANKSDIFPGRLMDYSVILHLRDPRDVLTSMFFSFAFSHRVRPGRFDVSEEQRVQWREQGIDRFVLDRAKGLSIVYDHLIDSLYDRANVTVVHYEEMVLSYSTWLAQYLAAFHHLRIPDLKWQHRLMFQFMKRKKVHQKLFEKHCDAFSVDSEDIHQHKRQVLPGDHRKKLESKTIASLNETFTSYFKVTNRLRERHAEVA